MASRNGSGLHGPLNALARAELEKFVALVELSNNFIAMAGLDQHVMYVNAAGRALVGLGPDDDVTTMNISDFLTERGLEQSLKVEQPAVRDRGFWQGESTLRHNLSGDAIDVSINSYLVTHPDTGEPLALATVQRDVRPQKRSERRQRMLASLSNFALQNDIEDVYQRTVDELSQTLGRGEVAIYALDAEAQMMCVASSGSRPSLRGFSRTRRSPSISKDNTQLTVPILGRSRVFGAVVARAEEPETYGQEDLQFCAAVGAIVSAAMARHRAEIRHRLDALHDHLTGLPNRALMLDRLDRALSRAQRTKKHVAVLLLDLDSFKMINDSFGHEAGDDLLRAFAPRLRESVRASDTVARLGGDEFVIICEGIDSEHHALMVSHDAQKAWSLPFEVRGRKLFIVASSGLAISPVDRETSAAEMLREADTAMYRAKQRRLGSVEVYTAEMHSTIAENLQLATDLQEAIESDSLFPVYQPIVDCASRRIVAVECLARWRRGAQSVPAREFIDIAESSGLIVALGKRMLERSCAEMAALRQKIPSASDVILNVNVSARQLLSSSFVKDVLATLERTGFPPSQLALEITEAAIIEDYELAQLRFSELAAHGVKLLLDDFGTGYSSLLYLRTFGAITALKIDRSFVMNIGSVDTDATIVKTVASLGHALGMAVTAEGVETEQQIEYICSLGCDFAQGYLTGRPAPLEELEPRFESHK